MTPTTSSKGWSRRRRWLLALGVLLLAGVSGGLFGLHWWSRQQLRTARDLLAEMRFEEAGLLLDEYLRIRPSDAEAHLLAAQAKRRAGDAEAAEDPLAPMARVMRAVAAGEGQAVVRRGRVLEGAQRVVEKL